MSRAHVSQVLAVFWLVASSSSFAQDAIFTADLGDLNVYPVQCYEHEPKARKHRVARAFGRFITGKWLLDVLCHTKEDDWRKEKYRHDPHLLVHETVHRLNSQMTMRLHGTYGDQALYLGESQAAFLRETKLDFERIRSLVPQSLRGELYKMYLLDSHGIGLLAQYRHMPYILLDEYAAHSGDLLLSVQIAHDPDDYFRANLRKLPENTIGAFEFAVVSFAFVQSLPRDKVDPANEPIWQLREYVRYMAERNMDLLQQSFDNPMSVNKTAQEMVSRLRTSPDAQAMRDSLVEIYGAEWTKRVLGF